MTATTSASISRSKAKDYVRDIRRAAHQISGMVDTVASNPEWAERNRNRIDEVLTEALSVIDGTSALLREGLGVDG